MTPSANRALSGLAQNLSVRYGLEAAADDLPIEDFEGMLGSAFNLKSLLAPYLPTQQAAWASHNLALPCRRRNLPPNLSKKSIRHF